MEQWMALVLSSHLGRRRDSSRKCKNRLGSRPNGKRAPKDWCRPFDGKASSVSALAQSVLSTGCVPFPASDAIEGMTFFNYLTELLRAMASKGL